MSTPLIWIAFPGLLAVAGFFLRRWKRAVAGVLSATTLLLAMLAWFAPIGETFRLGPWAFTLSDRLVLAGRLFLLDVSDRPMLVTVYLTLAFFFIGSVTAGVSKLFVPLGLAMGAILVGSLAVEPFLYAALLIQLAVLVGVPLLSPPGREVDRSVLRYLTFLSFGLPFLLFSGWLLSGLNVEIITPSEILPALVFLGFGFAFLLAVFPLNSWIPMLTSRVHPYAATFIIILLSTLVLTLLIRFIESYPWLLNFEIIQFLGVLIVFTGGLWAAFQRDLGRLLGYAIIIEIGRSILAISQPGGITVYQAMIFPRLLALGVWALSLSLLRKQTPDLSFRNVQGMLRYSSLISAGAIVGHFSLVGLPILAGFPIQLMFWSQLAQPSFMVAFLTLLGSFGLLVGGLRSLAVLLMGPEERTPGVTESRSAQVLMILGLLAIIVVGLFPQWFVTLLLG